MLRDLFADGFKVRAAVRDKDKGEYLLSMYPDNKDALEYVIVEDLAKVCVRTLSGLLVESSSEPPACP